MANTFSKLICILLITVIALPAFPEDKKQEESSETMTLQETRPKQVHQKMLEKLGIKSEDEEESLLRRGEIVFFVSFGFIYMYQFIIYDQILMSQYREKDIKGELSDANLYFAVFTSLILALFVARNEIQYSYLHDRGTHFAYPNIRDKEFDRTKKNYQWFFNFYSWEF